MNPQIITDFMFNPQNYLSYDKFVKLAIKDYRPRISVSGLNQMCVVSFPNTNPNNATIFKIDGAKIHKKLSDGYIMVSPSHLIAYGKTPDEFYSDWNACHTKTH